MIRYTLIALMVSTVMLVGCGGISTANMLVPSVKATVFLKEDFTFTVNNPGPIARSTVVTTVNSGRYTSVFDDGMGTYFGRPGIFMTERRVTSNLGIAGPVQITTFEGGIYVPRDRTIVPKIYTILGTRLTATEGSKAKPAPLESNSPIVAAGLASEKGKLVKHASQPSAAEIRAALVFE